MSPPNQTRSPESASVHPTVVLGGGLTGLSTALHLARAGRETIVVEREQRVGGKARSERRDGHTFDVTGHWLHLRDDRVRRLINGLFEPGDLVEIERRTGVYTHGVMLPYPFQANLHGLPLEVVQDCLVGFVEAQLRAAGAPPPKTFDGFAVHRFGEGIAREFFVPYNTKLWGEHYERLTPAWVSRFIPMPDVAQVIGGAIGLRQEGLGYNVRFLYPRAGGIDAVPEALARAARAAGARIVTGVGAVAIDIDARRVALSDGGELPYGALVSTVPLPRLVAAIPTAPQAVREAAQRLRWVSWRYLNVATSTPAPIPEHWVYVPEPDVAFFRVGVFSNALAAMAPPGRASLYVELADRTSDPDLPAIYNQLAQMGAITSPRDVLFAELRDVECAYVVFDDEYDAARSTIAAWLDSVGVRSCGRYGSWVYNSMEDSIVEGMEAAAWATPSSAS